MPIGDVVATKLLVDQEHRHCSDGNPGHRVIHVLFERLAFGAASLRLLCHLLKAITMGEGALCNIGIEVGEQCAHVAEDVYAEVWYSGTHFLCC